MVHDAAADIHPHVLASILERQSAIVDHQVRQTVGWRRHRRRHFADLDGARVTVRAVDEIARHPETGKLLPIVRL